MKIVHNMLMTVDSSDIVNGTVTIPDNVASIGRYAFADYKKLTSIIIPNSVTSIEDSAFYDCTNLTSVTIPHSVTNIGIYAFEYCSCLTSITIPDSVMSIGDGAFRGCTGLTSITIPDSVKSIGDYAFEGCVNLRKPLCVKATNSDMTCRDYQYHLGKIHFKYPHSIALCYSGFHYCTNAYDVLNYYSGEIGKDVRFFEVEVGNVSPEQRGDSKRVCSQIKLIREITSYAELLN